MLAAGADANARSTKDTLDWGKNSCVLEFALSTFPAFDTRDVLRELLAHGADPKGTAHDGKPLLTWAKRESRPDPTKSRRVTPEGLAILEAAGKK